MSDTLEETDHDAADLFAETPQTPECADLKSTGDARCAPCCGYRWLTIVLISMGMVVIHAQRVNVSVSLLAVYDNLEDRVGNHMARSNVSAHFCWVTLYIGRIVVAENCWSTVSVYSRSVEQQHRLLMRYDVCILSAATNTSAVLSSTKTWGIKLANFIESWSSW